MYICVSHPPQGPVPRAAWTAGAAFEPRGGPPDDLQLRAHDPATGALGITVATLGPAVGAIVPYARVGVGALATQSAGVFAHGPRGLDLVTQGLPPEAVLAALTAGDAHAGWRQLGLVDARVRAATFTGADCGDWAGGVAGPHYACQGNLLAGPEVIEAMRAAFSATPGDLDVRLLAALLAGHAAGGDRRGHQSAGLVVVRADSRSGFDGRLVDLRVDDHAAPVAELARLLNVWRVAHALPPHTLTPAAPAEI